LQKTYYKKIYRVATLGMNIFVRQCRRCLAVRGHDKFCSTVQYLQFKIWEENGAYRLSWLRTWQQLLMAIWFCLDPFVASANP